MARALYEQRLLFEWGGTLLVRHIEELPFTLRRMWAADYHDRRARFERSHRHLMRSVLEEIERRGPLSSRDLPLGTKVSSYRARRDTGVALYYLWLRGDLMIHSRIRGERRYDLIARLVSKRLRVAAPEDEARRHNFRSSVRAFGLPNLSELGLALKTAGSTPGKASELRAWIARE
ncbi:cytoplasmic protein, partial [mine drainage metagenome]